MPLDRWGSALAEALDQSPDLPAFMKDRERRFVWCSEPLARMAGFEMQQDLLGLRDEDVSPAHLAAQYRIHDERVLERGERMVGIVELVRSRDGRCDSYLSTKLPVRSQDGEIVGLVGVTHPVFSRNVPHSQGPPLAPAVALISREFNRRLSIADLARSVSMSPSHFNRTFKGHFGVTPHQYLRRVRLMAACDLLATTDLSMSAVASETGYYDQSHFANDFVREWDVAPSLYRKQYGAIGLAR
jgi:AraC-like DNA-binding protein